MSNEKEIIFKTNFNRKLDCDRFIHIQPPWKQGIPADVLVIKTADKSHDPVRVKIFDSIRQKLCDLSATFIYLSHGMDPEEFTQMVLRADPTAKPETELAVYFYKKAPPDGQ